MDANWSPDGKSLVFASAQEPDKSIYIVDLESKRIFTVPGSRGLNSPQWSPDGRYMAATKSEHPQTLYLFDFSTQKWKEVFGAEQGYPNWSHDGKYIFFENFVASDAANRIMRFRPVDQKTEEITNLKKVVTLTDAEEIGDWLGVAPDDSPLVFRDTSTQELYALEMEWQ